MRNGFTRARYELRALGASVLALPPLVVAIFLGVSLLAAYNDAHVSQSAALVHHDLAAGVLYLLEFGIPPVAGLAAAQLIAHDPATELHLGVVRPYRRTMLLRLSLFGLWTLLVAAAVSIAASRTGYWLVTRQAPQDQLTWLAPVVWCIGLGAALALALRSTVASSAILGMLWLGELLLRDYFLGNVVLQKVFLFLTIVEPQAAYWLANRLTLVGMGLVLLVGTALLLRNNEWLLGQEA
jgi:hypothetical protein